MKPTPNLYLVDDDDIFVFLTKRIIEETKLTNQIKVFSNGRDAIDFLEEVHDNEAVLPDIIFLDLFMPVLDGWGFLEEFILLKPRLQKKITIFVISSSISSQDIIRAKNISVVSDYIVKPITKEIFIETIKNLPV